MRLDPRISSALHSVTRVSPGGESSSSTPLFVSSNRLSYASDVSFFTDKARTDAVFRVRAEKPELRESTYDISADGRLIGTVVHRTFEGLQNETWHVIGEAGQEVATVRGRPEVSAKRRLLALVLDERMELRPTFSFSIEGDVIGGLTWDHEYGHCYILDLHGDPEEKLDRRLAVGFLAVA